MPTTPTRTRILTVAAASLGALLLVGSTSVGVAVARPDDGSPGQARKTEAASATWTEDDDTNDGNTPNNVVDDGDNAHPSGKDRSVEQGRSGNQGRSTSDPDDDGRGPDRSNGGPDKANGSGGVDLADQDGNNGCGNDDDFEDDNEGWCGRNPKRANGAATTTTTSTTSTTTTTTTTTLAPAGPSAVGEGEEEGEVLSAAAASCPAGMVAGATGNCSLPSLVTAGAPVRTEVLGASFAAAGERPVSARSAGEAVVLGAAAAAPAGELPFTGTGVTVLLVVALFAVAVGWALQRAGRPRTA